MITRVALAFFGHSRAKKWVRNPIENARGVIHRLGVPRNKRDDANIALFDAALPYTAAAALSLAIGRRTRAGRDVRTARSFTPSCGRAMNESTTRKADR
jgi:hypothetical protein